MFLDSCTEGKSKQVMSSFIGFIGIFEQIHFYRLYVVALVFKGKKCSKML